ncbi:hypothetical protein O181_001697 [Austropuccinia psidii MF-1]|uniref:Uncharacterized protein n=1 Tax=Austropuccinia psidii MF-1 TaxID=1389203 RepID=A0A9Q3GDB1_9BASI|nr:hypothetical protein [Austropuccinia psidii MF-1]
MLRWGIAIQNYRGNMTIIYKEEKSLTNFDGVRRWPLDNVKRKPYYDPEIAAKIPINFLEIDRKKNFKFSEWEPGSGTSDNNQSEPEKRETPILGKSFSELQNEFFNSVINTYVNKNSVA